MRARLLHIATLAVVLLCATGWLLPCEILCAATSVECTKGEEDHSAEHTDGGAHCATDHCDCLCRVPALPSHVEESVEPIVNDRFASTDMLFPSTPPADPPDPVPLA